jgi:hypothetical protein
MVPDIGIVMKTDVCSLVDANCALADLRRGAFEGAVVLVP